MPDLMDEGVMEEEDEEEVDEGHSEDDDVNLQVQRLHRPRLPLIDLRRRLCSNALQGVKGPKPEWCRGFVAKSEPPEVIECPGCLEEARRKEIRAGQPLGWGEASLASGQPAAGASHMVPLAPSSRPKTVSFARSLKRAEPLAPSSRPTPAPPPGLVPASSRQLGKLRGSSPTASAHVGQMDLGLDLSNLGSLDASLDHLMADLVPQHPLFNLPSSSSVPHLPPVIKRAAQGVHVSSEAPAAAGKKKTANIMPKSSCKPKAGQTKPTAPTSVMPLVVFTSYGC